MRFGKDKFSSTIRFVSWRKKQIINFLVVTLSAFRLNLWFAKLLG